MRKKLTLITTLSLLTGVLFAQSESEKVDATVYKKDIESHIYFLASDELKGRETGSAELDIAAAYIANFFRRHNVKPAGEDQSYYQNVRLEETSAPEKVSLKINDMEFGELGYLSVENTQFEGDAVYLGFGQEEDFEAKEVQGKLVVVKAGSPEKSDVRSSYYASREKRKLAEKHGAAGIVEIMTPDPSSWERFTHYFNGPKTGLSKSEEKSSFIHLWAKNDDPDVWNKLGVNSSMDAKLSVEGIKKNTVRSRNVIGYLEGADPKLKDEIVIYSAHYDHVGVGKPNADMDSIYNGARDNAVGTATVMSLAENFSKFPTRRSALFILFTGEEKGLLGSKYFVENPTVPLQKVVYCFNSDNGGYNDTSKATIFGLNRTTVAPHILEAAEKFGLTAIDDPAPEQNLFDRSDNVSFAAKGIPSPTFSLGFTAFDEEVNKYYHQVTDNPETLDYDYLVKFFKTYVLASRSIANDKKTPFWTEGDKYYETGKELYGKKEMAPQIMD